MSLEQKEGCSCCNIVRKIKRLVLRGIFCIFVFVNFCIKQYEKTLTLEQLEKRKKLNKKIFTFGCLPIIILFALFIWVVPKDSESLTSEKEERPSYLLTKAEMGDKYPFKIDSLSVLCLEGKKVVVWQPRTVNIWAVNGNALQVAKQNKWGTCKDDDIWNGKSLSFVLNKGLELCE